MREVWTPVSPESVKILMNRLLSRVPSPTERRRNEELIVSQENLHNASFLPVPDTEYANYWGYIKGTTEVLQSLQSKINGGVMVDLGGGTGSFGSIIRQIVPQAKLKAYINVERYYPTRSTGERQSSPGIPYAHESGSEQITVPEDMLKFLQHVPDDSLDIIVMNGIDDAIISHGPYREELARHIYRVLRPGGVIISSQSFIFSYLSGNTEQWKPIVPPTPEGYDARDEQEWSSWKRDWRINNVCIMEKI